MNLRYAVLAALVMLVAAPASHAATRAPVDWSWGTRGATVIEWGNTGGAQTELHFDSRGRVYARHGQYTRIARLDARGRLDTSWGRSGLVHAAVGEELFTAGPHAFLVTNLPMHVRRFNERGGFDTSFGGSAGLALEFTSPVAGWRNTSTNTACRIDVINGQVVISSYVVWRPPPGGEFQQRIRIQSHQLPMSQLRGRGAAITTAVAEETSECDLVAWTTDRTLLWTIRPDGLERRGPTSASGFGDGNDLAPYAFEYDSAPNPRLIAHRGGMISIGRVLDPDGTKRWTATRYAADGSIDSTFGTNGSVPLSTATGRGGYIAGLSVKGPHIDIALANASTGLIELHRLDATGQPVAGWGVRGVIELRLPPDTDGLVVYSTVALDRLDRAHVATPPETDDRTTIRRYATDSSDLRVTLRTQRRAGGWHSITARTTNAGPRSGKPVETTILLPRDARVRRAGTTRGSCRLRATRRHRVLRCRTSNLEIGSTLTARLEIRPDPRRASPIRAIARTIGMRDHRPRNNTAVARTKR